MNRSRLFVVALVMVVLTVLVAPGVLAGGGSIADTPSGGPRSSIHVAPRMSQSVPLSDLLQQGGDVTVFCMIDNFGFQWDTTATLLEGEPNYWEFTGTANVGSGYDWTLSGYAQKVSVRFLQTYWRADNPQANGCAGDYVDYFEYYGDGTRRVQDGAWNNYCSGEPFAYGLWSGQTYPGNC